jgi:ABC-2 type transport system permease protein
MKDGFDSFVRKETVEIFRTWRIWVLPGIALAFALSGPALAKLTPQILQMVGTSQPGVVIKIPAPTYYDSYAQWIKNLSQIVLFAIIIIYGGLVSSERRSGTAVLVLTKPVSRGAFVAAKALVHGMFITAVTVIGTLITWALTAVVFGEAPGAALWQASLTWLALAFFFLGLMTLLSVLLGSQAGAAGAGLGAYALLAVATIFPPMVLLSPAGLVAAPAAIAVGHAFPSVWPVLTALVGAAALVAWAAAAFAKQEL